MRVLTLYSFPRRWTGRTSLEVSGENAEHWDGRLEYEGNLGRTDVRLGLGVGRSFPPFGVFGIALQVPLMTRSTGQQVEFPTSVSLNWSR